MESFIKSKKLLAKLLSLKPENVLIDKEGNCVLSDFGLSEINQDEVSDYEGLKNTELTSPSSNQKVA